MQLRALLILLAGASAAAGAQALSASDSALVGRLLRAEDRRDTTTAAYAEGMGHADPRIQRIARRGLARSLDASFAGRDSVPALPAPPVYPEPAWRFRYRALGATNDDCAALRGALADSAWPVRLRAVDLVTASCATDAVLVQTLRGWLSSPDRTARAANGAAWQPAAHALVAIARVAPAEARQRMPAFARSHSPWVRTYAARAAAVLTDSLTLRALARDTNGNVQEAAIEALSKLTGHRDDALYVSALRATGYQAVRASALALKGSTSGADVRHAAIAAARRLRRDSSETSRDARMAVMARIAEFGDSSRAAEIAALAADFDCLVADTAAAIASRLGVPTAPRCVPFVRTLPADAVRLALGDEVVLRVTMAPQSGGGSFTVRLRGGVAPIMAARVLALVRAGWYDHLAWHRVEPNFVIQGPSRGNNEYVGHPRFLRDELGAVPHLRGTVGMSTRGHDTGDGQWFVNLKDNLRLGRDYTVFGEITSGMDVVDGVLEGDVIQRIEVVPAAARP